MPTPYNRNFTTYKSTQLQGLDCQTTGTVVYSGDPSHPHVFSATYTLVEAIEAGECIAMVRVPRGFTVTDVHLFYTANTAVIGVGDPFCCGRFLGPVDTTTASGSYVTQAQGTSCAVARLQKIGRGGDGCGYGYTYTCETDIIITNGYGYSTFQQGGGSVSGTAMSSGGTAGPLASGTVLAVKVEGYVNANFTNAS